MIKKNNNKFFKTWLIKAPEKVNGELMQSAEVVPVDKPSNEVLDQWFQSQDFNERGCAAWEGYKLDVLINDSHPYVRSCNLRRKFMVAVIKALALTLIVGIITWIF